MLRNVDCYFWVLVFKDLDGGYSLFFFVSVVVWGLIWERLGDVVFLVFVCLFVLFIIEKIILGDKK